MYTEVHVNCIGSKQMTFLFLSLILFGVVRLQPVILLYKYIFSEAERETQGDAATQLRS